MSQRYAVNCPNCQMQNEVEARQAGQSMNCPGCEKVIDVPTLRQMQQLTGNLGKLDRGRSGGGTNFARNGLFSLGMFLAILGLAAGISLFVYSSSMMIGDDLDEIVDSFNQPVAELSPLQLWENWDGIREEPGLPAWEQSEWLSVVINGRVLRIVAWVFVAIGAVGLMMAVFALMGGRPKVTKA